MKARITCVLTPKSDTQGEVLGSSFIDGPRLLFLPAKRAVSLLNGICQN